MPADTGNDAEVATAWMADRRGTVTLETVLAGEMAVSTWRAPPLRLTVPVAPPLPAIVVVLFGSQWAGRPSAHRPGCVGAPTAAGPVCCVPARARAY